MCITSRKAEASKTKILSYKLENGKHLLSYKNALENISNEPNCMIIPVPGKLTKEDFIDTTSFGKFFEDIEKSKPKAKSLSRSATLSIDKVEHFQLGKFEILIASNPEDIKGQLNLITESKRPVVSVELIDWFAKHYSNWSMVICCFNENIDSQPIMFTFEPNFPDHLYFPGVDSHGGIPNLESNVETDHDLFMNGKSFEVEYSQEVPSYMPKNLRCEEYHKKIINGDWFYELKSGNIKRVHVN